MNVCGRRASVAKVAALAIWAATAVAAAAEAPSCRLEAGPERVVSKILDAETVQLDDGSQVRLLGILAPRARDADADDGAWPPEIAARAELEALLLGTTVQLKFDGPRQDRYGRTLAHLLARRGEDVVWVQGRLLALGAVRASVGLGARMCTADLLAEEAKAQDPAIGLWAVPAYRVHDGPSPRELTRLAGRYVVVRGRVEYVSDGRDGARIYFGADRRRDLSATIRRGDRDGFALADGDPKRLAGRRVEVRGWITQRPGRFSGPDIDITAAGHIRVLD